MYLSYLKGACSELDKTRSAALAKHYSSVLQYNLLGSVTVEPSTSRDLTSCFLRFVVETIVIDYLPSCSGLIFSFEL